MSIIAGAKPGVFALVRPRLPVSIVKTASYMIMHLAVAMAVAFALTGSWAAALAIGMIEPAVQTVAYAVHEKAWRRAGPNAARQSRARVPAASPHQSDCP